MDSYSGTVTPPGMYVRALYDYEADDGTSLSFRQGDIIQVLTQLESGWWDGVIRDVRGWFPSNYCALIEETEARRLEQGLEPITEDETDNEVSDDGDLDENDYDGSFQGHVNNRIPLVNGHDHTDTDQEQAAFWIPQATPDGRLFYFNTLTGENVDDLPLESPHPTRDSGSRDRSNLGGPEPGRPTPQMMLNNYEREDDTDPELSASETEESSNHKSSRKSNSKQKPYMSNGASPATSLESLSASPKRKTLNGRNASSSNLISMASAQPTAAILKRQNKREATTKATEHFLDDAHSTPLTWSRLIEDMRLSVGRYRQAINARHRSEFVKRAEDISDHLRLLLAAGSGTTDNHSGVPSIISTNKALYPHFRDMMSRFSKLVLSSHIASADFAASDSYSKCLQEAEGMLNGVYGFVEVARQQRGEEIPRLFPGFVRENQTGGSWQNNGLTNFDNSSTTSFIEQDNYEPFIEPNVPLDSTVMERINDLKRLIVSGVRRLGERLVVQDKIISIRKHQRLASDICGACNNVIELYKPWMSLMESIDLATTGLKLEASQVAEFSSQKQSIYVFTAELVMACQNVAAPLADEWSPFKSDTLEDRVERVQRISKDLEQSTSQINTSLQQFLNMIPATEHRGPIRASYVDFARVDALAAHKENGRSLLGDISSAVNFSEPTNAAAGLYINADNSKVKKFFGEAPLARTVTGSSQLPEFLGLDHEVEVQYDGKTDPPAIKGGTLTGLVEQLTRHDRYDAPFKTTFLLTYQSFTTASELFECLIRRWSIQPPAGLSQDSYKLWIERKQAPVRFRIVNVLKSWFDQYWMEGNDPASMELVTHVYNFAKETVASSNTGGWDSLLKVIEQRLRGDDTTVKKLVPNPQLQSPLPILPKNMKKLKLLEIDPTEFARQLTIIEARLYGKIKPHELLNKIWQKKVVVSDQEPAANVKALILHSNRLTNWVAEMILAQNEPKKRVNVIKHFVNVADKCLSMNNFSTLVAIISALGTAPIHRLNRTWAQLNKATASALEKMRRLMGSTKNFQQYRESLHQANPPCIPFFGVYLTDLTFIEDGIPGIIKKTDHINFAKRQKTAEVIREIQTFQNVTYPFKAVPEIQDYVLSMMQNAGDVHEMYERSLAVEPREREDEKIARYATPPQGPSAQSS
ncbi:MAG: hypothetical protein M1828_005844 [Chrysothrix sp. TS-e1954]|nr:MAG: hypothetical protein M1828_005844 [Chrysothrix sp. TS-e1954]